MKPKTVITKKQKQLLIDLYASNRPRKEIQKELAKKIGVTTRTIRAIANELNLNPTYKNIKAHRILIYDIETSRMEVSTFWTGKQYINHKQIKKEPKIISISWKWVGDDKINSLTWDEEQCDFKMVQSFLKEYNSASMVVGQNNNNFDNKWINTRAAKHSLEVNRFIKSLDIYKMSKRYFRLPSHSMEFMANYFGLTPKQKHDGIIMWDKIEYGTPKEQKEYLKKMVDYNKGDIITTEELYMTLKPYFGTVNNYAVASGLPKWACPVSGSTDVKLLRTIFTEMGTVQRILFCEESEHQYKVSNKSYMDFLQRAMSKHWE